MVWSSGPLFAEGPPATRQSMSEFQGTTTAALLHHFSGKACELGTEMVWAKIAKKGTNGLSDSINHSICSTSSIKIEILFQSRSKPQKRCFFKLSFFQIRILNSSRNFYLFKDVSFSATPRVSPERAPFGQCGETASVWKDNCSSVFWTNSAYKKLS